MSEQVQQQVDHAAEAVRRMQLAKGERTGIDLELAQVHATLALHDQLERLNGLLAEVIDPAAGASFPGVVRVRTEGSEG